MTICVPDMGSDNGWYNVLPPVPSQKVSKNLKADWVVLGAGVTGLATVRRLAQHFPESRILLVEAEHVGSGNSGRNSGFVLHCWFMGKHGYGQDRQILDREVRLNAHGANRLRQLVSDHNIQCQWHEFGMLWAGAGKLGDQGVIDRVRDFEYLDQDSRLLDSSEMKRITGTHFYSSGVLAKGTALMQPALLCRGLMNALPMNVEVYEETPVTRIHGNNPVCLTTPDGTIETGGLVMCTNAFSPDLGFGRNRIVAGSTYASLTRCLTEAEVQQVGEDGPWGVLPGVMGGSTVRLTSDNRILMRNGFSHLPNKRFRPETLSEMRAQHYESIRKRWPELEHVEIANTWGGVIGGTRNRGHIFGKLREGIWGSIACNGANISRGTTAGELLADLIAGVDSDLLKDQLAIPKPSWLPPEPILSFFVRQRRKKMSTAGLAER